MIKVFYQINFIEILLDYRDFFYFSWHSSKQQMVIFQTLGNKRLQAANDTGNLPDFKDISIFYKTEQYYIYKYYIYSYLNNILSCTLNWKLETVD